MKTIINKILTPQRKKKAILELKFYGLVGGAFYIFYRVFLYDTWLGESIRNGISYFFHDPLQAIAILLILYGFGTLAQHTWWWWWFL